MSSQFQPQPNIKSRPKLSSSLSYQNSSSLKNKNKNNNVIILTQFGIGKLGSSQDYEYRNGNENSNGNGIDLSISGNKNQYSSDIKKKYGYNRAKLFNSVSMDQCRTLHNRNQEKNNTKNEGYPSKILKKHALWSKNTIQYKKYIKRQYQKQKIQKHREVHWPQISKIYKKPIQNILENYQNTTMLQKNRTCQRLKNIYHQKYVINNSINNSVSIDQKFKSKSNNNLNAKREGFAERSFLVPRQSKINYGNQINKFDRLNNENRQQYTSINNQVQNKQNNYYPSSVHEVNHENQRQSVNKKSKIYYKMINNRNQTDKY